MNESKRLIKNTGIIAIGNLSTKLVSFLLLPLYTALLSTQEYGEFDYLVTISTFCVPFVSLLMDESIFRFLIDCRQEFEKKSVISTTILLVSIGMLLFLLIGIPVMTVLRYSYTAYLTTYILLSAVGGIFSALLRGIGRNDQYALYNFLTSALQIVLNVILIAGLRLGLIGMLLASIISHAVMPVTFVLKLKLWNQIDLRLIDATLAKRMVTYSLPLIPNRISWNIVSLSSRLIIMNALGSGATGLYAVANKFPNLMDTIYGFFYQSWKESSARVLGDHSQEAFYQSVYSYLKNFLFALVIGMTAFMPLIFRILINGEFYEAVRYVPPLLLATYFMNISGFYGGVFTAYMDTKIMGTTTMVAAVINLVLNFFLVRYFGLYAAAISTLAANYVIYIYRKIKVRKYVNFKENRRESITAFVVGAAVMVMFYSEKLLWICVSCGVSVVYALIINRELVKNLLSIALKRR